MEVTTGLVTTKVRVPIQSSAPEGWRHVRLTDVARLESGHTPSKRQPDYWGGSIPWVSLHDTDGLDAWEIQTTSQSITEAGLANSSARLLPKGTVVFSRTATVGKSTVMGRAMATSQDFACYVCGPEVHNFYLALLLRSMRTEWKKLMAGSIHNTVYMPVFKTLSVDLPPHDEQVAIANAMWDVERMLDSLEQLLTKKRQIKQGAMQELLTGKRRLPGFSDDWEEQPLGDYVKIEKGNLITAATARPGEVPVIGGGKSSQYTHVVGNRQGPTITVSASGASAGYVSFYEGPIFASDCSTIEDGPGYSLRFVYYALVHKQELIYLSQTGGAQPHVQPRDLEPLLIDVPTTEDEQTAIAQILSDMDAEISALESRLTKARALKQAMAQVLLTGRIRLVEPTA